MTWCLSDFVAGASAVTIGAGHRSHRDAPFVGMY